eukprot:m.121934 g.121934  ORF g.121934 m.121934 type:complete len:530 (+) comp14587_c3_seq3:154-1743(+)
MGAMWSNEVESIERLRGNDPTLTTLGFQYLAPENFVPLREALTVNTTLTALNLSGLDIGNDGAKQIGATLTDNIHLRNLDLGFNRITRSGIVDFAAGLATNTTLHHLNIRGNRIGPEGGKALANAIEAHPALRTLEAQHTYMEKEGILAFNRILRASNHVLLVFHYDKDEHLRADEEIADALKRNIAAWRLSREQGRLRLPSDLAPPNPAGTRVYSQTRFFTQFKTSATPTTLDELFALVLSFLRLHIAEHHASKVKDSNIVSFRDALRSECEECEVLPPDQQVDDAAQIMWSSAQQLVLPDGRALEFCSLVNEAIRKDGSEELLTHVLPIVQAISLRLHIGNRYVFEEALAEAKGLGEFYPSNTSGSYCYRGSAMPASQVEFYQQMQGHRYRVPGYFTTSLVFERTLFFVMRSLQNVPRGEVRVPVIFRIHVDERGRDHPDYRCTHVARLLKSKLKEEIEFMFVPYAAFTVRSCSFFPAGTYTTHELFADLDPNPDNPTFPEGVWLVDLEAALDSHAEPASLPLAGYY